MYSATTNITAGTRFEDVLWNGIANNQYPAALGREKEFVAERLAQHNLSHSNVELELPSGRWVRAEERRTADGGIIGVRVDVTELKSREASFRLLFEHNPIPMWVLEQDSMRFLAVNDAAVEHYGFSREQFLAMDAYTIRPADDRERLRQFVETGYGDFRDGQTCRHVKANGTAIDVAIYSARLTYQGRPAWWRGRRCHRAQSRRSQGSRYAGVPGYDRRERPGSDHCEKRRRLPLRPGQSCN
jgi:PAS domain S-box-containing protein